MAKRQTNDEEPLNPLLIFAIISTGFVLIIMVIFIVLVAVGANSVTNPKDTKGPYDVIARLVPTVDNAAALLPKQLGSFQRGPLTGSIDDFQATYKSSDFQIDISGSRAISVASAQAYVKNALQANDASAIAQRDLDSDPAYYLTSGKGRIHYVWSHYIWYFNVTASSQAALDEFMKVFKY